VSGQISLLLVDDHALMRQTLQERLEREPDMVVVGAVENADRAVAEAVRLAPDVILMDIDMPGLGCFEAAGTIRARCAHTRIIFLSAFSHDAYVEQALGAKAAGYLTKAETPEAVVRAIRTVASGRSYFSPQVEERIVVDTQGARLGGMRRSRAATLTPRELEVLRYIARGLSQKEIAKLMNVGQRTAEKHTENLMRKLGIHDRVELSRFAIREGIAEA
jgi:DNA-binding NarL/FixJ family response regulator